MTHLILAISESEALIRLSAGMGAWLLTYLLHSTVLLSAALLFNCIFRGSAEAIRETVLRFALMGGLVSATATILMPPSLNGMGGLWISVAELGESFTTDVDDLFIAPPSESAASGMLLPEAQATPLSAVLPPDSVLVPARFAPQGMALAIMHVAFGTGCVLAVRAIALSHWRLARALAGRTALSAGSAPARELAWLVTQLRAPQRRRLRRIRLTTSDRVAVPIALGVLRPEICLPSRRIAALHGVQLRAMLAHELGHLVRRDPLWQLFCRIVESIFFFQPLNILARRALRTISEFQCDAWAARITGERTGLARVLADAAQWLLSGAERPRSELLAPASAMAERRSGIRRRIERLVNEPHAAAPSLRRRTLAASACIASIAGVALASPRFAPFPTSPHEEAEQIVPRMRLPSMATDLTAALAAVLSDLDTEIALLKGEAALLNARARATNSDEATLALSNEIAARIDLLDGLRIEALLALDAAISELSADRPSRGATTIQPPLSDFTGRRPQ